jgi:hypothetical protein
MGREDFGPSKQRYIERQIVMLTIFFQNCNFGHKPLLLKQLFLSAGQT